MDKDTVLMVANFLAKKVMLTAGGALISIGALHSGDEATQFETIGAGVLVGLGGAAWSWWNDRGKQIVLAHFAKKQGVVPQSASVATAVKAAVAAAPGA